MANLNDVLQQLFTSNETVVSEDNSPATTDGDASTNSNVGNDPIDIQEVEVTPIKGEADSGC